MSNFNELKAMVDKTLDEIEQEVSKADNIFKEIRMLKIKLINKMELCQDFDVSADFDDLLRKCFSLERTMMSIEDNSNLITEAEEINKFITGLSKSLDLRKDKITNEKKDDEEVIFDVTR
uniref:Conjugal transfer protein n=1 Tax=Strongyloides stercoralis TaxID=6248 RepID=A0A0K0ELN0_STRER